MASIEEDLLPGLRDLVTPDATGPGTLFQLDDTPGAPDVQWALSFTRGPTDALGRWGQGVLLLLTRGNRSEPLPVHGYADPVVRRLMRITGTTYGSTTVNSIEHRGSSSGPDASKRTIRADTFFLDYDLVGYQA